MWSIKDLEPFFFEAMRDGYASRTAKKRVIEELPQSRLITFQRAELMLTDCWQTNPDSLKSFGQTVICANSKPVWMMAYWGQYPKDVIPFLKEVLCQAYKPTTRFLKSGSFSGCRGTHVFRDTPEYSNLTYSNHFKGDFSSFEGREEIVKDEGSNSKRVGWHNYHGMLLI